MNLFRLSWKNLTYKPLAMLLSLILFALGVGLIALLLQINQQVQEKFESNLAGIDLVIGAKGSPLQLILCNMYHIDSPTGNIPIKSARPFLNPKHPLIRMAVPLSLGDNHKSYRIVGTTHTFVDSIYPADLVEGQLWQADMEVCVGATVAEKLNMKVGDLFHSAHGFVDDGMNIHDQGDKFKVVGIFEPTGTVLDQLLLTNTQSIWAVHEHEDDKGPPANAGAQEHNHDHDHENDHAHHDHDAAAPAPPRKALIDEIDKDVTSILVRYRSKSNWRSLNLARNINENTDMQAATPAFEMARLTSMMGTGEALLRQLAIIIVIVSGLSIFISLFSSLKERRYELALMRVMGATRERLFLLIVLEGLLLALIGYVIGILLSHIGMQILAVYMEDAYRYSFSGWNFMQEELWLLVAALGIGFLAAILPAIQASRTDISTTLTDS